MRSSEIGGRQMDTAQNLPADPAHGLDNSQRPDEFQDQVAWPLLSSIERARLRFLAYRRATGRVATPQQAGHGVDALCDALLAPCEPGRPELWDAF